MTDLSVVIPTFNEYQSMPVLLEQWRKIISQRTEVIEIIVVDDNSPDGTADIARTFSEKIPRLVIMVQNERLGIAPAWITGCSIAKGRYIGIMDADLCHSPSDMLRLFDKCRSAKSDLVIGSRYLPSAGGMRGKGVFAILASRLAQIIIYLLFGAQISDATHSFRVFRGDLKNSVIPYIRGSGNSWLMEFSILSERSGLSITEIPISYGIRQFGRTKLNLLSEGVKLIMRMIRLSINR